MTRTIRIVIFLGLTISLYAGEDALPSWDRLRVADVDAVPCGYHHHHGCSDAEAEAVFWAVIGLIYGGECSIDYMHKREIGESLLPMFRAETSYLYDDANRGAFGSVIEGGWGLVGGRWSYWDHYDLKTNDHVGMTTWHVLYRMLFGETVEIDLGGGGFEVTGDFQKSGGSGILGVRCRIDERISVEYFRSWHDVEDDDYSEHDLALRAAVDGFSLKLGYRYLGLPDRDLKGPYVGVAVTF